MENCGQNDRKINILAYIYFSLFVMSFVLDKPIELVWLKKLLKNMAKYDF